jgi:hypothetical protein
MISDLNDIYEEAGAAAGEQQQPPVKGPVKPVRSTAKIPQVDYMTWRAAAGQNMSRAGTTFRPDINQQGQADFLGETGVYDPALTGKAVSIRAGEEQSFGSKIARRLGNLVPNVAADIVDIAGSTISLLTEWGDERDYRNGLNELADAMKNPMGENYRRSNDTWAIGDPTWWIDNAFNTIEFAGAYALTGAGVARTIGSLARGVSSMANAGLRANSFLMKAAELGTSAFVSYAQGAQDGSTVFKEVYENQFRKALADGLDPDTARINATHIAAESAATTAQLSTLLTMAINSSAYSPALKSQEMVEKEILASRIVQGRSPGEIGRLLRSTNPADYMDKLFHHSGVKGALTEMVKEGGEEVLQQFARETGSDIGNKGQTRGFFQQLGEVESLIDRTANSEGLLSFTLGAAFGGLQHTLLRSVIPSRYVEKMAPDGTPIQKIGADGQVTTDEKGNPVFEKHWVTPRTYEKDFTQRSFTRLRDALAHDYEQFELLKDNFLAARKEGNALKADEIRDELFNTGKLYAVKSGMTEPWKKTFQQIANLEPKAAVEAGYAASEGDTRYREKAQEAITDLDTLSNRYRRLQQQYGLENNENPGLRPLVDMLFAREADLYSTRKRLDTYRRYIEQEEKRIEELPGIRDISSFEQYMNQYLLQHSSASQVQRQLKQDLHTLTTSRDPKVIDRLLKKYRAVGFGEGSSSEAIRDLEQKLIRKNEQILQQVQTAETAMLGTTDYQAWLQENPQGSFDQFIKEANEKSSLFAQHRFRKAQLQQAEAEYDIARQNLQDMTSEKNAERFSRKAEEWRKELIRQQEEIEKLKTARLAEMTRDKSTLNRLERIELNKIAEKHRADRDSIQEQIRANKRRLHDIEQEKQTLRRDPLRRMALRREARNVHAENELLAKRSSVLDSLFRSYSVDEAPAVDLVDIESVTGEQSGKATISATDVPTTNTTPLQGQPVELPELSEPVFIESSTPEDILKEIESASPVLTIADEMAALKERSREVPKTIDTYEQLLKASHPDVQLKVDGLVDAMLTGTAGFSLDLLNTEIADGRITRDSANKLLLAAKQYTQEVQSAVAQDISLPDTQESTVAEEKENILVATIGIPDTPTVETSAELSGTAPESSLYHAGYKIIEAAYTGATSTIGYEEGTRTMKNGETAYIKVTRPDAINPGAFKGLLDPKWGTPGHPVRYEVDTSYNGEKLITDSLSWDEEGNPVRSTETGESYLDKKGKVMKYGIGNVPIKVVDAITGETINYIRKIDWINARYPGTSNYRNIVDKIETEDGTIDNLNIQRRLLMELRTRIVEQFNTDGTAVPGRIASKGTGRLILNHVVEQKETETLAIKSKVVPQMAWNRKDPEASLLPQRDLELVIIGEGSVAQSGKNFTYDKPLGAVLTDLPKGAVGAMVPAANGSYMYAPLVGMKLVEEGKPSPALSSVARAIELYILNDGTDPQVTAEIDEIESNTNFNIGTVRGLKAFINQYYTYSQRFQDAALSPNIQQEERRELFVFSIDEELDGVADKTRQIKVGFTTRGDGARYANLVNGKLDPQFLQVMEEGFRTRSRAVVFSDQGLGIQGINSSGSFTDAVYIPQKGWRFTEYDNYNQYVKSFSRTPVYGRNRVNGRYIYTANPVVSFEPLSKVTTPEPTPVKPSDTATVVHTPQADQARIDADVFDNLGLFSRPVQPVKAIGTGAEKSTLLTLEALQEKYNFTPEIERNGKTVRGVLEELTSRGHTYLSDGFNPFSRCL